MRTKKSVSVRIQDSDWEAFRLALLRRRTTAQAVLLPIVLKAISKMRAEDEAAKTAAGGGGQL